MRRNAHLVRRCRIRFLLLFHAHQKRPLTTTATTFETGGTDAVLYASTVTNSDITMTGGFSVTASGASSNGIHLVGPVVNTDVSLHTGTVAATGEWVTLDTFDQNSDVTIDTVVMK